MSTGIGNENKSNIISQDKARPCYDSEMRPHIHQATVRSTSSARIGTKTLEKRLHTATVYFDRNNPIKASIILLTLLMRDAHDTGKWLCIKEVINK